MSDFNFEPFKDVGSRFGNYKISVVAYGGFGFQSGFYKREKINDYTHVILSYDKSRKAVGFTFTNDATKSGACKISHNKNSGSVATHSFFNAYEINPKDYTGKYEPKKYSYSNIGEIHYIIIEKK